MLRLVLASCVILTANCEKKIGDLETKAHKVSGELYALDDVTLKLKNFNYDGQGPDAFFWVGTEGFPNNTNDATTKILAYPNEGKGYYEYDDGNAPILGLYTDAEIILPLPPNMKVCILIISVFYKVSKNSIHTYDGFFGLLVSCL